METNNLNNPESNPSAEELTPCEENAAPQEPEQKPQKKKKGFWREAGEWVASLAVALVVVLLCQNFLFSLIRVDGESMLPTLQDGERLFVTVADVKFGSVDRNSVVICRYPNRGRTFFVKRLVGVPGDTVYRQNGVTHIVYETVDESGETITVDNALDEQYANYLTDPRCDYEPYVLGEDEYFVVGDNRYNSHDSRDWNDTDASRDVGPISKDMVVGRVRQVIWPLSEIRSVD